MTRKFETVDYEAALDQTVSLREALQADYPARFVVDLIAQLNLSEIHERYGSRGGEAQAPEVLLAICRARAVSRPGHAGALPQDLSERGQGALLQMLLLAQTARSQAASRVVGQ